MRKNKYLSVQQAAKVLKVATKTLRRWEARGVLVPFRTEGEHRRYTKEQLVQFLKLKSKSRRIRDSVIFHNEKFLAKQEVFKPDVSAPIHLGGVRVSSASRRIQLATPEAIPPAEIKDQIRFFEALSSIKNTFRSQIAPSVFSLFSFIEKRPLPNKRFFYAIRNRKVKQLVSLNPKSEIRNPCLPAGKAKQFSKFKFSKLGFWSLKLRLIPRMTSFWPVQNPFRYSTRLAAKRVFDIRIFKLVSVLSRQQKIVYASFISLFLILSLFSVIATPDLIRGKQSLLGEIASSVASLLPRNDNSNLAIEQFNNESQSVLAESTVKPDFKFYVNVPSLFRENGEFLKDLKVSGKSVFGGSITADGQDLDLGTGSVTASNVVYSISVGDGLAITGTQTPKLTNTGVLSFQGSTGTVTLTAGTGISISGTTITNSSPNSNQNIFKTIKVSSTTFDAGSTTDTLEFAAGTGISLSSDTSNKKLTITGDSGWTDGGTAVYLTTASDGVGIGTSSPNSSSVLDLTSTSKGMLAPRMTTTQRDAISSPATGLLLYNTTTSAFNAYTGSSWNPIGGGDFTLAGDSGTSQTISSNDTLTIAGGTNGIDTVAGSTDTVTLNFDATEVGTATWGSGSSLVWTFDAGSVDPTIDFNTGSLVFNEGGSDIDFRIEGDNNANLLTLDAGLFSGVGQFSIGSAAQGTATSFVVIDNPAITATSNQNFYKVFIDNNAAATVNTSASLFASMAIDEPNISGAPTNAATLYLSGAPTEGSSGNFALWVDNGESRFENLPVSGSTAASALTVVPSYIVEAADLILSGVRIALDTNSNTDSGDTAYGLNIDDITTAAGPTEYAMRVGSGYDYQFFFELGTRDLRLSATAPSAGTSPLTATIPALTADDTFCLSTLGNCFGGGGGTGVTYTSQSTNAIAKFTSTTGQITASSLTDDGTTLTLAANVSVTMTAGTGSITGNFSPVGTTSTARALTLTPTFGIDVTNQTLAGLYINPNTNTNTDTGDVLSGVHIDDITASSALESAIKLGSGWDNQIYFTDTTTIIKIANGGSILFEDDANGEGGDGNNICTISDGGDLTCTGSISGGSSGTQGYWSRTSTTLSPATANDVLSVSSNDNTNATLAITNNTANTIGAAAATGIVDLASTSLTTGTLVNLELTEGTLNGGYYLKAWDATAGSAVFSIGEDGNTTIAGLEGSTMLTLTAGDAVISDGSFAITDDDDAASFTITNNTATTVGAGVNTTGVLDLQSTSLTTGNFLNIEVNGLSTGKGLNLTSTSTALSTGSLAVLDWSPGSSTTATGDMLSLNVGSNGIIGNFLNIKDNGSSVFSVSQTAITNALPASFTAAGDVAIAYDLNFTNPTASYIKSSAPIYIQAGEVFNASDLNLSTYHEGSIVLTQDNQPTAAATSYAVQVLPLLTSSTNSMTYTALYGLYNLADVNLSGNAATDLTTLYSNYTGLTATAGTIDTWYGNYVAAPTGSGTVTTAYGQAVAALSNATSYGLDIGALSGATANYSINIGNITSAATANNFGIKIGTITSQASATSYGISTGAISGAGTASYGINLGANSSTATTNYGINIGAISGAGTTNYGLYVGAVSGATSNYAAIFAGGNVGIGTTAPSVPFEVKGTGTGANIAKFTDVNTTGCTLATGGTISCSSDISLKKNISDLSYGLDSVMSLNPIAFNWRSESDGQTKSLGFIAQEVEQIIPKLVTTDSITGLKELNTIGMVPVLVKAIQEQQLEIASLSARLLSISEESIQELVPPGRSPFGHLPGVTSLSEAEVSSSASALFVHDVLGVGTMSASFNPINLESENATISGSLSVLGRSTFTDLGVTGTISNGLLSIDGLEGTINTLGTPLKLQSEGIEGIEMMAGKVTIDTKGNISTKAYMTAKKYVVDTTDPTAQSLGSETLPAGFSSITISTIAVNDKSKIFITPKTPTGGQELYVSKKTAGQGFVVSIEKAYNKDVEFDWWVVDEKN